MADVNANISTIDGNEVSHGKGLEEAGTQRTTEAIDSDLSVAAKSIDSKVSGLATWFQSLWNLTLQVKTAITSLQSAMTLGLASILAATLKSAIYNAGGTRSAEMDDSTGESDEGYLVTIDQLHHKVHEGEAYTMPHLVTTGATYYVHIKTPNTAKRFHLFWAVSGSNAAQVSLFRDATLTGNGTVLPSYNNDLNSAVASDLSTFHTPSISAPGTIIEDHYFGTSVGSTKSGGGAAGRFEWILKQNTSYLLRLIPASSATFSFNLYWYEYTPA